MKVLDLVKDGKNILVYDVAASSSGALSVLRDFYEEVAKDDNKTINWIFVISTPYLEERDNIKILRYPWIKKSWLHRLFFDYVIAPWIVKKNHIDRILNLQNVRIPVKEIKQVLYVHQPLPFVSYKFGIKENFPFWVYQNIIGKLIFNSIKAASSIIVQTLWMKEACIVKTGVDENKIYVIPPEINIQPKKFFIPTQESLKTFFYPAMPLQYKNHQLILETCKKLLNEGIKDFSIIFTFKGNENNLARNLYNQAKGKNLPIEFAGNMSREQVFEWYTKAILLFPSYIETFGLPLLEARMHNTPIIAADTPFAREILAEYEDVCFHGISDAQLLCKDIESMSICEIKLRKFGI